jgi:hypothetical protein
MSNSGAKRLMNEAGEEKEMRKGQRDEGTGCKILFKRERQDRCKGKTKNDSKGKLKG